MDLLDLSTLMSSPNKLGRLVLEIGRQFLEELLKREKSRAASLLTRWWFVSIYVFATGTLMFWTVLALFHIGGTLWNLTFWICATSALITLLPILSRYFLSTWRIVLEVCVLAVSLILFARQILGLPLIHRWSLCAVLLFVLLSAGGDGVDRLHNSIRLRLAHDWAEAPELQNANHAGSDLVKTHLDCLYRYFISEFLVYSALPIGTLLGLLFCLVFGVDFAKPAAVVSVCLRVIFGLGGSVLIWFLGSSFIRMISPVLRLPLPREGELQTGAPAALDWGCILTDYRKMFFYDAILNTALILTCGVFEWYLWNWKNLPAISNLRFLAVVLLASIVLIEVPYLIGQKRVHRLLITPYKGWEKGLKMKELGENIPLVPKFESIAALVAEASAGGIALEMMKQIAEAINKRT